MCIKGKKRKQEIRSVAQKCKCAGEAADQHLRKPE
jgi:hypothetical protein